MNLSEKLAAADGIPPTPPQAPPPEDASTAAESS